MLRRKQLWVSNTAILCTAVLNENSIMGTSFVYLIDQGRGGKEAKFWVFDM